MQVAMRLHHLGTRAQHQVKGIAQNNLGTNILISPGSIPFTVP